jgi:hypothetical protein
MKTFEEIEGYVEENYSDFPLMSKELMIDSLFYRYIIIPYLNKRAVSLSVGARDALDQMIREREE